MKAFNDFDKAKENAKYKGSMQLPVGGYEAKIKEVRFQEGKDGNSDMIVLAFDITAGEYKDFFKKKFDEDTSEDKKWKGKATIYCPKDDGSEQDEWTKNAFARWTNALEESNNGYVWDWDEKKWKGKNIGLIYGETGTVIDGKPITYTEVRFPESIQNIKDGNFKIPKFKSRKGYDEAVASAAQSKPNSDGFMNVPESIDEDLPF